MRVTGSFAPKSRLRFWWNAEKKLRTAVIREVEIALRNDVHAKEKVKILKLAAADTKVGNNNAVWQNDAQKINRRLVRSLRRVVASTIKLLQSELRREGVGDDRIDRTRVPERLAPNGLHLRPGDVRNDADIGNDGTNNVGIFGNKRTHARTLPKSTRLEWK